jgi:hypothetical protein
VTGNLTVTDQTSAGYLYLGPNATNDPTSSSLNFPKGDDRANGVTVALDGGGGLSVTYVASTGSATTDVIFDVTGYFASSSPTSATWTVDLYDSRAERWQNPDNLACTAASTESMLNTIAYDGSGPGFVWQPTVSYDTQESILAYERANMTMLTSSPGTDPHGWRNALNYYGWGSTRAGVYSDKSFDTFDAAVRSTVSAIALYRKPVGILGWAGNHAQIITGYRVTGGDPRTGTAAFSVVGVYLTDPLRSDGYRDRYVPLATWKSGGKTIRFTPYLMTNSPYKDPIDGKQGNAEWDGKWVVVVPVA